MAKDLNTNPYYDDFDEFKNFHQILFKPGYAVQARELTQLQTILRKQIEKFGNHIFKHGSVVLPGNSMAELDIPCVVVNSLAADTITAIVGSDFEGKDVTGVTSGVKATIKKVREDGVSPVFYITYRDGSGSNRQFLVGEQLQISNNDTAARAVVSSLSTGSLAHINDGVYYIHGNFVTVAKQSVFLGDVGTPLTSLSERVLLKITEEIVDFDKDNSLLDPARGSYNFAAPGADRLKVSLELVSLSLDADYEQEDYVEVMRYRDGNLEAHYTRPIYNELEKTLARRTYDESGDYIVTGYDVNIREHLKKNNNGGIYGLNGNSKKIVYDVSAGRGYIDGFEIDSLTSQKLDTWKARKIDNLEFNTDFVAKNPGVTISNMTTDSSNNWTLKHEVKESFSRIARYGQYILVNNLIGAGFDIEGNATIDLYDISASGTKIGTASIIAFDHHYGDGVSTSTIYKAYIFNIKMTKGTINDVGRIQSGTGVAFVVSEYNVNVEKGTFTQNDVLSFNSGARIGKVANWNSRQQVLYMYKHTSAGIPIVGDYIVNGTTAACTITAKTTLVSVGQSSMIFQLPYRGTTTLKVATNTYDLEQTTYRKLTIASLASASGLLPGGVGTIPSIEIGNFIAINATTGVLPISNFTLSVGGDQVTTSSPVSGITTLYVQTRKTASAPKTKTKITDQSDTILNANIKNVIYLTKRDGIKLTSVTSTVDGDVTNRFMFDDGQTDYSYGLSAIKLKLGHTLPAGNLTVVYDYYQHGVSGDYFSVDSYSSASATWLDEIPSYTSPVDGKTYELRDCIDYRSGTTTACVVIDNTLKTSYYHCLPRTDLVVLGKDGKCKIVNGIPSVDARSPAVPSGFQIIQQIYVPAYTYASDDLVSTRAAVTRSTMKDIANINTRISKLEEYATLTAIESATIQTSVLDAKTGLDRYKSGYLTESMVTPLEVAEYLNAAFKASWNNHGLIAQLETVHLDLALKRHTTATTLYENSDGTPGAIRTSNGYTVHNGGFITLNYTEKVWASQSLSSGVVNLNPFLVTSWDGTLALYPPSDVWEERVQLAAIARTEQAQTSPTYIDQREIILVDETVWDMETSQIAAGQGYRDQFGFFTYVPPVVEKTVTTTVGPSATNTSATTVSSSAATATVSQTVNAVLKVSVPIAGQWIVISTPVVLDRVTNTEVSRGASTSVVSFTPAFGIEFSGGSGGGTRVSA